MPFGAFFIYQRLTGLGIVGGAVLGALYEGAGSAAGNLTYSDLNTLPDADLRAFNEDLTKIYTENLRKMTNFTDEQIQSYVDEAMKDKSRAGTINRILGLQNELNQGQVKTNVTAPIDEKMAQILPVQENTNVNLKMQKQTNPQTVEPTAQHIVPAQIQSIDTAKVTKIQNILSVDNTQLSKMSVPELKQFAAKAAKLNAESMGVGGEKLNNYIYQSTASNDPTALIKNIEGIKGDLGIELNNMVLQDGNRNGTIQGVKDDISQSTNINIDEIPKELRSQKPRYAPEITKWQNKGGRITIDDNGIWTYHDWESNAVSYPDGYPDFKSAGMVIQEVSIGKFESYQKDFTKADELNPNGPMNRFENTYHHHQDLATLQEMNSILHKRFTHEGGMSNNKK